MYAQGNPKTKKALKEMLAKGPVDVFQPGLGTVPEFGNVTLEGPHYPEPHRWYASGKVENYKLVSIK